VDAAQSSIAENERGRSSETPPPETLGGSVAPRNPAAFEALGRRAPDPAEGPSLLDGMEEAPAPKPERPRRGRPPVPGGARAPRTVSELAKAYSQALTRLASTRAPADETAARSALHKLVQYARDSGLLARIEVKHLRQARSLGFLESQEIAAYLPHEAGVTVPPAPPPRKTATDEAPAAAASAPTPAAVSATAASAAAPPAPPKAPPMVLVMGEDVEKVRRFAFSAAMVAQYVVALAKRPGFDPTEKLDLVLFRGTPAETPIQGLPAERFAELLAVEGSKGLGAKVDAGSPWARRIELVALGSILLGPTVKARAADGFRFCQTLAAKAREKVLSRRREAQ